MARAFLRELCHSLLFFAGAFLQRTRQLLPRGALRHGYTHALSGAIMAGGTLLFSLDHTFLLLPGAFLRGPLAF